MSEVKVGANESLENALKRFRRDIARAGILKDARKHQRYEKPSVKKKLKAEAARRKNNKKR